jgi:putative dimethyl sulfoxide reductase chaperone
MTQEVNLNKKRANVYRLLSYLYHDEVSEDLMAKLADKDFIKKLRAAGKESRFSDLGKGLIKMAKHLSRNDVDLYRELSFEYADLFLNAGPSPVLPYESVHATGVPVVMQASVFDVRTAYREAGVHKSEDYRELDDHIAVELEFVRYLLERNEDQAAANFINTHLANWMPDFHAAFYGAAILDFYKGLSEFTLSFVFRDLHPQDPDYETAIDHLNAAIDLLHLGDAYLTLAPGATPEGPEETLPTHCYICGALCGQLATVKDGILMKTSGLKGDPKSDGAICPKGAALKSYVYSAHRLKEPLIRENGRFRKASWDEALDRVAEMLKDADPEKVIYFRGNDWNNWYHEALFDHYGAHKVTHRPMCDNANRMANEHNLNDKRPWLNTAESDYMIFFGQNPISTSYGRRQVTMIRAALKRGAKMVVFDPRRSETAIAATEWLQPIPGTDGAVAMAMCHVIVKEALYNKEFVENWTYGFEDFRKRLMGEEDGVPRTPLWAEKISGIPAATIERIAREFAAAKAKGVGSWAGVSQSPNGYESTMAVQALNGLMGTFDAPGGPSLPFKRKLKSAWGEGQTKPPTNSPTKLDKARMWAGAIPSLFPKNVAEGRIKGMINWFGDPVLSWGNEAATATACRDLDFLVTIDAWMPNVGLLSDVVLPDCISAAEDSQVKADWLYEAFIAYHARLLKPLYNCRPWWWMCREIARRLGLGEYFPWVDIEEAHANMLKGTPWSFEELKEKGFLITDDAEYYKHKKWGSFNVPEGYASSGKTVTGKYNFKNPVAEEKGAEALPDYVEPPKELQPDADYPLIFANFRILEHEHCSTFNNYALMKISPTNPLWINTEDAMERGVREGDRVVVRSPWGHKILTAHPTPDMRKGVVGSAGGFGHLRGLEADPKYPRFGGVNTAGLVKENCPDPNGGNPIFKYVKVQVEPAITG